MVMQADPMEAAIRRSPYLSKLGSGQGDYSPSMTTVLRDVVELMDDVFEAERDRWPYRIQKPLSESSDQASPWESEESIGTGSLMFPIVVLNSVGLVRYEDSVDHEKGVAIRKVRSTTDARQIEQSKYDPC